MPLSGCRLEVVNSLLCFDGKQPIPGFQMQASRHFRWYRGSHRSFNTSNSHLSRHVRFALP